MISFEEQIQRLEHIMKILDHGNEPMSLLPELYEEGIKLAAKCHEYLESAEQRVTLISNGGRGNEG